jgi:hypothetical protein
MGHLYHRKLFNCPWVTHHLHFRNIAPSAPIQYGTPPYSCTRVRAFTSLGVKSTLLLPSLKLQTTWFHGWVVGWVFHLAISQIAMEHEHICMIYLSNMVIFSIYQKEIQCLGVRGDWKGQTWITKGHAVLRSLWRFHLVSLLYTLKAYRSVEGAVLILNYSSSQFPLNTSVQSHCFYIPILVLNIYIYIHDWLLLYLQVDIPMAKDWWYWWNVPCTVNSKHLSGLRERKSPRTTFQKRNSFTNPWAI